MRVIARSLCVAFVALLGAIGLAVAWSAATAIQLLATTALIMGGTGHPLVGPKDSPSFVTDYLNNAVNGYIEPAADAGTGTKGDVENAVAVVYPAEFFPVFGSTTFDESVKFGRTNLKNCLNANDCKFNDDQEVGSDAPLPGDTFVAFGYSQSAVVASLVKQDLIDDYEPGDPSRSFILAANPMRPNGGILMRGIMLPSIPFFGITFYGATPTDSAVLDDNGTPLDPTDDTYAYPTADYAQQYDGLGGDFPFRPLNLLATVNALLGYAFLHGDVVNRPANEALYQGKHGDTTYYMYPTELVPILMPLQMIGVPKPILSFFDEFFRVIIEDAYLRDINPGVPTAASLLPIGNPIGLVLKLLAAIPVAIDNFFEDLGLGRVLGTTASGPFGVGGPPLPAPPSALDATSFSVLAPQTEVVEDDNAESVAPETQSLVNETGEEPAADPEPVADVNEDPEEEVETTTPEPNETPAATDPDQPEVRGPIQFDSQEPQPNQTPSATDPDRPEVRGPIEFDSQQPQLDSPPNDQDDAEDNEPAPDPGPAAQNDDQDAAA